MMHTQDQGLVAVVTTIQLPTSSVHHLHKALLRCGGRMVVIGDEKGPASFELERAQFFSLADQRQMPFALARTLPVGHYARKNLGYLQAIADRAPVIYETDDDNAPSAGWLPRARRTTSRRVRSASWVNVYRMFTDHWIWPRGYPLTRLHDVPTQVDASLEMVDSPIHQGLADVAPDVDAVWRMVYGGEFYFDHRPSVELLPGAWCPFNSQTTWWWPEAYPLLYLPSYCSFRMCDIWRSFIAQRCLWEMGFGVIFHAPEVSQNRNAHCLARDFEDEIPGYTRNEELIRELADLRLESGVAAVGSNLLCCYRRLVACEFFPEAELSLISDWLGDLDRLA